MSKLATLLLITVLAVSSLIVVSSAFAQSITKPSIPEFTAEYVDYSYDIAPTYTTDPYTNNTVIQTYGDHVDNRTVVITIKNEPFTPFNDTNGNTINMFFNVRYKGAFGEDWTRVYGVERSVWYNYDSPDNEYGYKIQDYASQNTVVVITSVPSQGQMDIQVEALQGYTNRWVIDSHIFFSIVGYTFYGEESGWSDTKTVTLGETSTSTPTPSTPTPSTPTPSPSQSPMPSASPTVPPEPTTNTIFLLQEAVYAIAIATIIIIIVLLVYFKKRK
jgi:hypothetical protein